MLSGGCHCGTIRYEMSGDTIHHALCHCTDCRKASGAPAVSWGLVPREGLKISGSPKSYKSSEHGRRHFCPQCGTSLFYTNEQAFPGQIDVQIATLDDPDAIVPQAQIQIAERIGWMERLDSMPKFERYPGM